jgi:uncharacterized membrane protein YfcA
MDFTIVTYIGGGAIALFIGFLTGIFGVGGGFLMTPALMILLCIPGNIAVGIDLAVIFVNSSFGIYKRRGTGTVDIKLAAIMACGSVTGVLVGLKIMESLKDMSPLMILGKEQSPVEYILLCLFFLLLAWISVFLAIDLKRSQGKKLEKRVGLFSKIKVPPYIHFNSLEQTKMAILPVILLGFGAGILTGLLGVGGGVVVLPALVYLVGQRTSKATGTSLGLVWASSAIAATGHMLMGNTKLLLLAVMLVSGIVGTHFGTHIGLKLDGPKIRFYFVYVVIAAVLMIAFKLHRMTFA